MAGNYGPEVKAAMTNPGNRPSQVKKGTETPADRLRDERRGIKEGSPQDLKLDAMPANQAPPAQMLTCHPVLVLTSKWRFASCACSDGSEHCTCHSW